MSEIEKMYKNASIKKHWNSTPYGGVEEYYPPFTAEKQIGLIKWMADKHNCYDFDLGLINLAADTFEEGIASVINNLWHFLTEEEQQQVKGILE